MLVLKENPTEVASSLLTEGEKENVACSEHLAISLHFPPTIHFLVTRLQKPGLVFHKLIIIIIIIIIIMSL